ncbi:flavodoxin 1 [Wigglesworthia glossinidia endosymbiont of Glossina morsitans morsitans (Yale colony)]|uniref:Flavodoxin n=1 Tax=Wigglesworthia glossinidia endosymbiont of Glossina morsitans morsitans (Yale colony) TaxID=1142511 RepID=H6Q5X5_WIGGL|nr:flavodoxin FldA [Wigglesworthia glossinidia]AFA41171.1 flavodoxin 1 [Wigglesworthia glossinidia endosymbiont of Glossina morsitans morsitans (Yale colony)]
MKSTGIFFGSDTGNTASIAKKIQEALSPSNSDIFDIADTAQKDIEKYDKLIFGIPTWYYGEPQCDWDDFFPILKKINFKDKMVAIFGCGDQEDYSEYFCDAMGILNEILIQNQAKMIGSHSTKGYKFEASKALINKKYFVGLALDEDRQPELTESRLFYWIETIKKIIYFQEK